MIHNPSFPYWHAHPLPPHPIYNGCKGVNASVQFRLILPAHRQSNDDVEVRWEDQQKINTFGRLNTRMHDLEDEIKEKLSTSELLEDAANEIILADDDEPIRYVFGECYFEVSKDRADELLEGQKATVDKEIDVLKKELDGINDTLASLKKQLYARFGNNINLEE